MRANLGTIKPNVKAYQNQWDFSVSSFVRENPQKHPFEFPGYLDQCGGDGNYWKNQYVYQNPALYPQ